MMKEGESEKRAWKWYKNLSCSSDFFFTCTKNNEHEKEDQKRFQSFSLHLFVMDTEKKRYQIAGMSW